jgi:hypothetical protein
MGSLRSTLLVAPLRAGKAEAWRRFCQTLAATAPADHADAHRRFGISAEQIWLVGTAYGDLGAITIEAADPAEALRALANSPTPFDCWFRRQLLDLCGVDLAQPTLAFPAEHLFAWGEARGP